jgi:NADPH:quinone reductase-like Zn-dependent oxidoreductase
MKAIVLSDNRTPELRDLPDPTPKSGQVLLQVDHCGICGSDLHAATYSIYRTGVVMGHEFSGRILDVGKSVTGWQIGDRVCINPQRCLLWRVRSLQTRSFQPLSSDSCELRWGSDAGRFRRVCSRRCKNVASPAR